MKRIASSGRRAGFARRGIFHDSLLARSLHQAMLGMAAMSLSLAPVAFGGAVMAQTVAPARTHYAIPAGSLESALAAFARTSGVLVAYTPDLVEGVRSAGLNGDYAVDDALQGLLAGTGLAGVATGGGKYTLRRLPPPDSGSTTLPAVQVSASAGLDGTTEGTGSYAARSTATATKLPLSLRETPQTVTVVTRQQMDDFGMTTVDEALKTASGVFVYNRGSNGNDYYSRGFVMQTQYDGIPNPIGISSSNRTPRVDSAFLDRVEILQGASGLTSGAGDPGGTINLVRKRPTHDFQASAEVQLGSWNARRVVGDISAPLVESGAVRARVVALQDDADSFIDYANNEKKAFYGVVDADLGATTTLNLSAQYQKDKGRSSLGIPFGPDGSDLGLPRSSYFGNANGQSIKETMLYTLGLEQKLPGDWVLKAAYNRNDTEVDNSRGSFLTGSLNVATGDGLSLSQYRHLIRKFESDSFDVYASGPVTLFGRKHELVFGANGAEMRDASRNSGNATTPVNIYDFDPTALPEPVGIRGTLPNFNKTEQQGFFGVGRFNLADSLQLIVGSRVSWYEFKNAAGLTTQKEDGIVSPYAGLIYDIDSQYSAYASYSDIFKPQSNLGSDGNPIKPVVGSNYELGIKGELLGGKLNVAAAVFRLEQTNLAKIDDSIPFDPTNICNGRCYLAADKVVSQGADFSLNGELAPGWNAAAGYTYVESEYASGAQKGQSYMTYMPRHNLRLATSYRQPGADWSVGGNVRFQSGIYRAGTNYRIEQGGVALVGLTAKYWISQQAELTFVVDNLFDRRYYDGLETVYYSTYGEPRRIALNLKYRF